MNSSPRTPARSSNRSASAPLSATPPATTASTQSPPDTATPTASAPVRARPRSNRIVPDTPGPLAETDALPGDCQSNGVTAGRPLGWLRRTRRHCAAQVLGNKGGPPGRAARAHEQATGRFADLGMLGTRPGDAPEYGRSTPAGAGRRADHDFCDRLLAGLSAAQEDGGDLRGRQSAALLVVAGDRRDVSLRTPGHHATSTRCGRRLTTCRSNVRPDSWPPPRSCDAQHRYALQ